MFCIHCGEKILDGAAFCTKCGAKVVFTETFRQPEPQESQQPKTTGFAVASMILGIFSILLCAVMFLSLPSGILGIVFSSKCKKSGNNSGMAKAGMITGIVGLCLVGLNFMLCTFRSLPW
ncbi:MAG: zinc-ribbon domain-containing protein [Treponema sp.]|nr:zinc-ribbon domain-containing protein [Treponema sp.]